LNKKIIFLSSILLVTISVSLFLFGNEKFQNELTKQIIDECKYDPQCAVKFLQDVSQSHEKETIMNTVNELIFTYSDSLMLCHIHAHHLGNFVYGYLGDVKESIELVESTDCGGSAIHSIVKSHLDSQMLSNTELEQVDFISICPDSSESPTIDRWECLHGVGHGLASIYGYDMPSAVTACQQFEDWEQVSCAKGLFMENVVRFKELGDSDFDENDLEYPCNVIDDTIAAPCYHYQPSFVNYVLDSVKQTIDFCKTVKEKFSENCFRGVGKSFAPAVIIKTSNIDVLCNTENIPHEKLTNCYKGVAMVFADNRNIPEALKFCQSIPEEFQNDCIGEVGKWIKLVNSDPDSVQKQCQLLDSEKLVETCMNSKVHGITIL